MHITVRLADSSSTVTYISPSETIGDVQARIARTHQQNFTIELTGVPFSVNTSSATTSQVSLAQRVRHTTYSALQTWEQLEHSKDVWKHVLITIHFPMFRIY
jgi:hypothetical protein